MYPNCDVNVWLRSCEQEIIDPLIGTKSGEIPEWINGSLLRNGPGSIQLGDIRFNHLFDSAALLHRFNIENGSVTYQSRFLQSNAYKQNLAANRITLSEFGTVSAPDPCQSIYQRFVRVPHIKCHLKIRFKIFHMIPKKIDTNHSKSKLNSPQNISRRSSSSFLGIR